MHEEWRAVVGFEAEYEVSDAGRVRRIGPAAHTAGNYGGGAQIGRVLKQHTYGGYPTVQLWRGGSYFNRTVHRLVAAAFLGVPPAGMEVNHIDGNKSNPAAGNLEYVTPGENKLHAYRTGLKRQPTGPNGRYKLSVELAERIHIAHVIGGKSCRALGREHGVSDATIRAVLRRRLAL